MFAVLLAAGCQEKAAKQPRAVVYSEDVTGAAKSCTAPAPKLTAGQENAATMTVGNDGGWCGILLSENDNPFTAGLLTMRPQHGKVFIHTVGDDTRIDYTPTSGYAGPDNFTVTLLPEHTVVKATVTVTR